MYDRLSFYFISFNFGTLETAVFFIIIFIAFYFLEEHLCETSFHIAAKIGALFLAERRKLTVNLQRSPTSLLFSPRQGPSNTRWREWKRGEKMKRKEMMAGGRPWWG